MERVYIRNLSEVVNESTSTQIKNPDEFIITCMHDDVAMLR